MPNLLMFSILIREDMHKLTKPPLAMWERWDSMLPDGSINPGEMTSFNHYALGSVASWLHSTLGGISPLSAGWKKVLFAPIPGGTITSAKSSFLSPYGLLECSWDVELSEKVIDGKEKGVESSEEGKVKGGEKVDVGGKKRFKMSAKVPPNTTAEIKLPGREERIMVGSGEYVFESEYADDEAWPPKGKYSPFAQYEDRDD